MQVIRVDHVHIEVTDRDIAADWYAKVLGLRRNPEFEKWADHPQGPLILIGGDGAPALSLFARSTAASPRDNTIAYRVTGADFLEFVDNIETLGLRNRFNKPVTKDDATDHDMSWSIYFTDPDDNRIEITTYDHAIVSQAL